MLCERQIVFLLISKTCMFDVNAMKVEFQISQYLVFDFFSEYSFGFFSLFFDRRERDWIGWWRGRGRARRATLLRGFKCESNSGRSSKWDLLGCLPPCQSSTHILRCLLSRLQKIWENNFVPCQPTHSNFCSCVQFWLCSLSLSVRNATLVEYHTLKFYYRTTF